MLSIMFYLVSSLFNFWFWKEIIFSLSLLVFAFTLKLDYFLNTKIVSYYTVVDNYSGVLIFLSIWITSLCVMSSLYLRTTSKSKNFFLFLMMLLLLSLFFTFMFNNLIFFYLGFEFCLLPIFFLILGFGGQPERLEAGIYMFFYTLLGSLPLLVIILSMIYYSGSSFYFNFGHIKNFGMNGQFVFLFFVLAFLIKFPIYSMHLWLLKAHVEAPVAGSMILAGVLLKLGGYGLIRVLGYTSESFMGYSEIFSAMSLMGAFFVGMSCLRHFDMKLLVASSSVVHMSFCIICVFLMSDLSCKGVMITMIAHGLCSSGLFFSVNNIYERVGSRSIMVSKGVLSFLPSFCFWWFMLLISNMAAPPTINLLGEIVMILSIIYWESLTFLFVMLISFFSAAFSLYLFSFSTHGNYVTNKNNYFMSSVMNHFVFILHVLPINLIILYSYLLY